MYSTDQLAQSVRACRLAAGLTQKELAQKLFVRPQTVSKWENGVAEPELETLCRLANLCGTDVSYFLRGARETEDVFLGVDGGGTKTEFLLQTRDGREKGHLITEGCNPTLIGIEETLSRLLAGIRALNTEGLRLRAVFCGVAGCAAAERKNRLEAGLSAALPGVRVCVEGDIANVFACAGCEDDAAAAICGTGVVVYARHAGTLHRIGGWGRLFDCRGSGYDVGREVLRRTLAAEDGFLPETDMTREAARRCGGRVFDTLADPANQNTDHIASFAPLAFEAYRAQDADAVNIVRENAAYFAGLIAHAQTYCDAGAPVVLSGGLIRQKDILLPLLQEALPDTRFVIPEKRQVEGAWSRAVKLAED